jgi:hypothetical protein
MGGAFTVGASQAGLGTRLYLVACVSGISVTIV